jgi:hypothetical protein
MLKNRSFLKQNVTRMRTIDVYVSGRCPHDATIQHTISLAQLQNTFCVKFLRPQRPSSELVLHAASCLDSPMVALYTFPGDEGCRAFGGMDDVWERVASAYLRFLHQTNADASGGGASILNQSELRHAIVSSCRQQWDRNYEHFTSTAALGETDKRAFNICCGKLLRAVVEKAPMRFRTFQYEHAYPIPLIAGDRVHFGCTIQSHRGTQRYDIRLLVSE